MSNEQKLYVDNFFGDERGRTLESDPAVMRAASSHVLTSKETILHTIALLKQNQISEAIAVLEGLIDEPRD